MRLATRSLWLTIAVASVLVSGLFSQAVAGTKIRRPIATGKDFMVVFPKATWGNQSVGVLLNSPSKQKITITTPTGSKGVVDIKKAKTTFYYPGQFRIQGTPGYRPREATRITSQNPISVHGQFGIAGISGTFTAIPVSAWGTEYYAVAPPEGVNSGYYYYPTIYSVPMICIMAQHAGTSVTIVPTAKTSKGYAQDVAFTITLPNVGDVYNVTTCGDPSAGSFHEEVNCEPDLTGTHIVSNFPVGVLVGQTHSTWPCGDNECGDACMEFLPPVCNWDSTYVVTPSVPRLGGAAGEALRIVFGHDGTDLYVDDNLSGERNIGTFAAGQFLDYPQPIGEAIVLRGSQPFMCVEITRKPQGCFVGTSGGENWTLGMVILSGVNQWGDYTPFSTAVGSSSVANVFFRADKKHLIRLNGKLLVESFPIVKYLPLGYATIPIPINAGAYNELTGDSGATAGGSIFGYGTLRYGPGGDKGEHTQDPEVIKSFAHPIGVNALPACNPDVTPPHITVQENCGHWDITALDDELDPPGTGIYDVYLAYDAPPDSSFNVAFKPVPSFTYGDTRTTFGIDVINNLDTAWASLHIRDGAGNEYDTLLVYYPQDIRAIPEFVDVGALRVKDSTTASIVLKNFSNKPANFSSYRLRYGLSHHWTVIPPSPPQGAFTIAPGDSVVFWFQYNAPNVKGIEIDDDTLLVTTCKEFPVAVVVGQPKLPGIFTADYDFDTGTIDTLGSPADTLSSFTRTAIKSIWVTSIGTDTLHISNLSLIGDPAMNPTGDAQSYPASDYTIGNMVRGDGTPLAMPTTTANWLLAPLDTFYVEVIAHFHHSGTRPAALVFENDADHIIKDTAYITGVGLAPGILARGIDYGTHLYATVMDSFFVVKNTGATKFDIVQSGMDVLESTDTGSFVLRNYTDPYTGSIVRFDTSVVNEMFPADPNRGLPGDTLRVPWRFLANKLGKISMDVTIVNNGPVQPTVTLEGNVIQPRVYGSGSCPSDSIFLGSSTTQDVKVGNNGTAPLTIESITPGGADAAAWTVQGMKVAGAARNLPMTLQVGEEATVTLQFTPTKIGQTLGTVAFVGLDALGRHSADSANNATTYYKWNSFPYDTTVDICNRAFATGISSTDLHLEQYVARTISDTMWIINTGGGAITVSDVTSNSPDVIDGFVNFTLPAATPFNIAPGSRSPILIEFKPGTKTANWSDGRRNYVADFVIENSTGTPRLCQFTGRGHMVDMHSHIPVTYQVAPMTYAPPVQVLVDQWTDTLGTMFPARKADMRGFIFEVVHYKRTVVRHDSTTEIPYNESPVGGTGCEGANGTLTQGGTFKTNWLETTMKDTLHNWNSQGYYEVNVQSCPQNAGGTGTLFNMRFYGLVGLDSSRITYLVRNPTDETARVMEYVNITQDEGAIWVDSVCGLNLNKVRYIGNLALNQNSPNPFAMGTTIRFSQPEAGHVRLAIVNSVGDLVATLVDQDLTKGEFTVDFDGKGLPSGLYTYQLTTGSGNVQKQMMLMR